MPPGPKAPGIASAGIGTAGRAVELRWRAGVSSLALLGALTLGGAPAAAHGKPALPQGGSFVAGTGTISRGGDTLTITQSKLRGVIDWSQFSIGSGGVVRFQNGAGATLNRVTGGQESQLLGTLTATGSVYLINPAGVLVGKGGTINTGGSFVASTLDVGNDAFMTGGNLAFTGGSAAAVKNAGVISATDGDVLLIARTVENSGSIAAPHGTAGLAAGQEVLLQEESGDQRIFVQAPGDSATNSGTIAAAAAELKAAGGNVYALAGNNDGQITATGTAIRNGHVWLTATGGSVTVSGNISAQNADGSGGEVVVAGDRAASINGTIDASATAPGKNGGTVTVDANRVAIASGAQLLAAGAGAGAGGNIETSGHTLSLGAATINAGSGGSWLIDPTNLAINAAAASTIGQSLDAGTNVTAKATGANGGDQWQRQGSEDWRRSDGGNIEANAAISWNGAATLSLSADNQIDVRAPLTAPRGGLALNAGDSISATAAVDVGTFTLQGGAWRQVSATLPSFSATDFALSGGSFLRASGGSGTSRSPYRIADVYGLEGIGSSRILLNSDFALANNIDASGTSGWNNGQGFAPIGGRDAPFRGSFDGQGKMISNLAINRPSSDDVGLFGDVNRGAAVENVALSNAMIVGNNHVGVLAGESAGTILQSYASGAVAGGGNDAGGLVGRADSGSTITRSYSSSAVTAEGENVGGLAGENDGVIDQAYGTGAVKGADRVGGLVGYADSHSAITRSYSTGAVIASGVAGGLIGDNEGTTSASFWDKETSGQSGAAGLGSGNGITGLTTAQFQNTTGFMALASGWDFSGTWAPSNSSQYPELYALSPVVYVATRDTVSTYGTAPTFTSTMHGGPGVYIFGPTGDTLAQPAVGTGLDATTGVGTHALSGASVVTSTQGVSYSAVYSGSLTIDPLAVILTGTRTYDGTTTAAASILTVANDLDGANLTLSGSGILAGKNVGIEALTSLAGVTLGGSAADNYTLAGASGSVGITPATLTYVAEAAGRTYGAANPSFAGTVTGFVHGETLAGATTGTLAFTSSATAASNVGRYAIDASGLSASNYVFVQAAGNATALTINPAALTASLIGAVAKTYDGTTTATLASGNYQLSGVIGRDSVALNDPARGSYASKSVGTGKTVSVSGLALSGADAGNYVLSAASISGAVGTITPATLTASLVGTVSKIYDGTTSAMLASGNYALSGVIGSDAVALDSVASGTYDTKNAGTGKMVSVSGLSLSGADAGNYLLAAASISGAVGTITPATLSYVADPTIRLVGAGNPSLSGRVSGFVGSDTQASVTTGSPVFTTAATSASAPGSYAIDGAGLVPTNANYVLAQAPGNATALTVLPAPALDIVPPTPPQVLVQLAAPSIFSGFSGFSGTVPSAPSTPVPGAATPGGGASFAGCVGSDCNAQSLAQADYVPVLPGNDSDRAAPIRPW